MLSLFIEMIPPPLINKNSNLAINKFYKSKVTPYYCAMVPKICMENLGVLCRNAKPARVKDDIQQLCAMWHFSFINSSCLRPIQCLPSLYHPPTQKIHPDYPKSQQLEERHLARKSHEAVKPPPVSFLIRQCLCQVNCYCS